MPFLLPSVMPETEEQYGAFDELDSLVSSGELSSALGWAVAQGKCLDDNLSLQKEIKCSLRGKFKGLLCHLMSFVIYSAHISNLLM